ncbi:MAG: restriction endonuclease subunit S, partial [Pyramidobacter sp.]|nr:restriction endonuclease subunit S [Pyramidobacter sp.]
MPNEETRENAHATEGPYPVPGNWRWGKGNVLFKPMEVRRPIEKTFLYIDIDAIDNKRQIISAPKLLSADEAPSRAVRGVQCGDTLFSMVRPYLKNIAFVSEQLKDAIASSGFYVCRPRQCTDARYIYRLMTSPYVVDGLNVHMKGDNSPSIRKNDIEEFLFPVPPLSEQRRIVERVERLFAKLDAA